MSTAVEIDGYRINCDLHVALTLVRTAKAIVDAGDTRVLTLPMENDMLDLILITPASHVAAALDIAQLKRESIDPEFLTSNLDILAAEYNVLHGEETTTAESTSNADAVPEPTTAN